MLGVINKVIIKATRPKWVDPSGSRMMPLLSLQMYLRPHVTFIFDLLLFASQLLQHNEHLSHDLPARFDYNSSDSSWDISPKASRDLDLLWPPDSQSWLFCALPHEPLESTDVKMHVSCSSLVTDERTDGRTNKGWNGQVENIMPASIACQPSRGIETTTTTQHT